MTRHLLLCLAVAGIGAPPVIAQDLERSLREIVLPYVQMNSFTGSVLVAAGDDIVYEESFGLADRTSERPNDASTAYLLASSSRVFTSAAVMLLEQRGQLALDDPLSAHLPDWPNGADITIHHLLTLSAGFPNINGLGLHWWWERRNQTATSLADKFKDLPLLFPPGTRSVHSNSNYVVLALLVERVSGVSFGEFLRDGFFEPLEMTRSGHFARSDQNPPGLAVGYQPEGIDGFEKARHLNWSAKTGHASIYSSAADLHRFDRALRNAEVLDSVRVARLFEEYFPSNGYGWFVQNRGDSREGYINGRSPGYGSYWGRALDGSRTVIVLGNYYGSTAYSMGRQLMAAMAGDSLPLPQPENRPVSREVASKLVGRYTFGPEFYRPNGTVTIRTDGQGVIQANGVRLLPSVQDDYAFLHRQYGSLLEFVRDDDGTVTGLRYDGFEGMRRR